MPVYCYRRLDNGELLTVLMTVAEREERENPDGTMTIDGVKCARDWMAECGGMRPSRSGWPLASEAMAVHPDQIPEAREHDRRHGVPTDYDRLGRPIFTSREHRKRYARSYGWRDYDGGDGDP